MKDSKILQDKQHNRLRNCCPTRRGTWSLPKGIQRLMIHALVLTKPAKSVPNCPIKWKWAVESIITCSGASTDCFVPGLHWLHEEILHLHVCCTCAVIWQLRAQFAAHIFCRPHSNLLSHKINRKTVSVEISYNVCNTLFIDTNDNWPQHSYFTAIRRLINRQRNKQLLHWSRRQSNMFCTETVQVKIYNLIIYTMDILSGLIPDKLKLLEMLLWIFLINI